jgi:hypothetical protein
MVETDRHALGHGALVVTPEFVLLGARPGFPMGASDESLPRALLDAFALGVHGQDAELAVQEDEALPHAFDDLGRPGLRRLPGTLRQHASGGLDDDGDDARGPAALIRDRRIVQVHPDLLGRT